MSTKSEVSTTSTTPFQHSAPKTVASASQQVARWTQDLGPILVQLVLQAPQQSPTTPSIPTLSKLAVITTSTLDRSGVISTKSSSLLTHRVKAQTPLTTLNTILLGRAQAKDHICSITAVIITLLGHLGFAVAMIRMSLAIQSKCIEVNMPSRSKPATGAEYKIMMCRSTSATGGFVDKTGKSCTANGGSILLASHSTTYGPGGQ
jgi:hypothetical protein